MPRQEEAVPAGLPDAVVQYLARRNDPRRQVVEDGGALDALDCALDLRPAAECREVVRVAIVPEELASGLLRARPASRRQRAYRQPSSTTGCWEKSFCFARSSNASRFSRQASSRPASLRASRSARTSGLCSSNTRASGADILFPASLSWSRMRSSNAS